MAYILLVDDDELLRRAIGKALRRVGHDVAEAGSGQDAMRAVESKRPALILTDINMPEMDGIEVVMQIRRREPGIPVIAMSGGGIVAKELLLLNAEALGAVATLSKPFELDELIGTVDRVLAEAATDGADGRA